MPVSYRKSGTSFLECQDTRRVVRVVYGGGLENRCTARYRGFESLTLRFRSSANALLLSLRARDIPPIYVTRAPSPLSSEEGVDGRSRRKPRRRRGGMSEGEARIKFQTPSKGFGLLLGSFVPSHVAGVPNYSHRHKDIADYQMVHSAGGKRNTHRIMSVPFIKHR